MPLVKALLYAMLLFISFLVLQIAELSVVIPETSGKSDSGCFFSYWYMRRIIVFCIHILNPSILIILHNIFKIVLYCTNCHLHIFLSYDWLWPLILEEATAPQANKNIFLVYNHLFLSVVLFHVITSLFTICMVIVCSYSNGFDL